MMTDGYKQLGDYIREVDVRNGTPAENRHHGIQEGKQSERRGLLQTAECIGGQIQ